jgi:hypothetical protein
MIPDTERAGPPVAGTGPNDFAKLDAAANSRTGRPAQLLLPILPPLRALKGEALPVPPDPERWSKDGPPREPAAAAPSNTGGGL